MLDWLDSISGWHRALLIIALAAAAHLLVVALRLLGARMLQVFSSYRGLSKMQTMTALLVSVAVFAIYFGAAGFILTDLGVPLTAYLASASIIGLAVGFGSQGAVQDVVTGLTVIFSDLFDLGDLVEVSGQVGVVVHVGMRFTVLTNATGAQVFIPNRTISNVINYPSGYVRCLLDVTLPDDEERAAAIEHAVEAVGRSAVDQFPSIHRRPPGAEGRFTTASGKKVFRYKFRIWPGRGALIEGALVQELLVKLREIVPDYAQWMIAVSYEAELRPASTRLR